MDLKLLLTVLGAAVLATALIRLIQAPLRLAARVLLNTALGFLALWLVNLAAPWTGVSLGLNLFNALVVGILGVPGLLLLLLARWVL